MRFSQRLLSLAAHRPATATGSRLSSSHPLLSRHAVRHQPLARSFIYLPVILQPGFWRSLVPTFLRPKANSDVVVRKKGWNPATFYIWMFMLIGSQGVQMLTLRGEVARFTEETEARLSVLRNVVKRIQAGETVDVEKELGTGEAKSERAWEDVVAELEEEDKLFQSRRQRIRERRAAREAAASQNDEEATGKT